MQHVIDLMRLAPNKFTNSRKNTNWNCIPLSVGMAKGTPHVAIHCSRIFLATVSAEISIIANAADSLLKRSTVVSKYLNPLAFGRRPTMSMFKLVNLLSGLWKCTGSHFVCLLILCFWHLLQICVHCWISLNMVGQRKRSLMSLVAAPLPGGNKPRMWWNFFLRNNGDIY